MKQKSSQIAINLHYSLTEAARSLNLHYGTYNINCYLNTGRCLAYLIRTRKFDCATLHALKELDYEILKFLNYS